MSENLHPNQESGIKYNQIVADLTRTIRLNRSFHIWMACLSMTLIACLYAYFIQLQNGLGVTGLRDYNSWGMYIANFVFFVASSLIGMLISAVLGLIGYKWITPITRIAEIIAIAFAAVAGLVIVSDMGRPDRLLNVFIYGRFQSPILWDLTVVMTYVAISTLLLLLPLIPDMAICYKNGSDLPKWQRMAYKILSFGWKGTKEQYKIIHQSMRILLILIIPVALSIHTVTSWLFASTPRVGWDSSIFGPYFVSGAFVAGVSCVIIAMNFFRNNYKLKDYITDFHFDKIGKLFVLVALVYLYFNLNEFLVPAYKMKQGDAIHIHELFAGRYAFLFWSVQLLGLIIPIILLLFKPFRKPGAMTVIAVFVLLGSWFKRYLIVVPTMEHPYLPVQNVPLNFHLYTPTVVETSITIGTLVLVLMIISVLSKLLPIIPIWETAEQTHTESDLKEQ
jgi:Ni/Fe-hydrogenase subunit HybB-like protein